ncbi:hypothetical protein BLNAU_2779 [Blattamonas nauphoetae]|uniref:Uncharacterized protein n=1 Tax=Blattamonas nauphoetae TaxID=2049346 RepID=A0ABQ9YEU5_9EUKA|nr:hypothetical protein BLNAU_2779 [Blattamonas nauphoetae]
MEREDVGTSEKEESDRTSFRQPVSFRSFHRRHPKHVSKRRHHDRRSDRRANTLHTSSKHSHNTLQFFEFETILPRVYIPHRTSFSDYARRRERIQSINSISLFTPSSLLTIFSQTAI